MTARLARAGRQPYFSAQREAVGKWLLTNPQITSGPEMGGVVGEIGADGSATYVYPEITGYYLQWLAWLAREPRPPADLAQRAQAAQAWLSRWSSSASVPATRVPLVAADADWRNRALFCFDVAMVVRGLASASAAGLVSVDASLLNRLRALLSRLVGPDGVFTACVAVSENVELPAGWSTARGPFLAKAAAGVLSAVRRFPDEFGMLLAPANDTLEACSSVARDEMHPAAHPALYAIEGLLCASPDDDVKSTVVPHLERLLDAARRNGARLPESPASPNLHRTDVVAQLLRAAAATGVRLRQWHAEHGVTDALARTLADCVREDGAVQFSMGAGRTSANVWSAMFTEQALAWHDGDAPEHFDEILV